jgi:hypothetical protein
VPWGSLEKNLTLFKLLYKLVIALSFTVNKTGNITGEIHLVCFIIASYLLYKRCTSAHFLNEGIQFATIVYESLLAWLFLILAIHVFSDTMLTLFKLATFSTVGLLIGLLINVYSH